MSITNQIELESSRLKLRRPTKTDAQDIFSIYASDPDVTKYLLFAPHKTIQETLDFITLSDKQWENKERYNFVIVKKEDSKLIGGIGFGFTDENKDVARIGYLLSKEHWSQGYATEACLRMIEFAKESGVRKLVSPIHPENKASIRVLEKCGFQEDVDAKETLFLPNLEEKVQLVGLSRSLSMSTPPPNLIWEG
ncbi:hypothetical protein ACHAXN_012569 [Cyclotella atomus]|jgi:ribosomal-protein-alanine N-acetyltransferase